jgi:hypothetical protein
MTLNFVFLLEISDVTPVLPGAWSALPVTARFSFGFRPERPLTLSLSAVLMTSYFQRSDRRHHHTFTGSLPKIPLLPGSLLAGLAVRVINAAGVEL